MKKNKLIYIYIYFIYIHKIVLISINLEIFGGLIKLKISPNLERKRSEEVKFGKELSIYIYGL